jgi:hypothetical protein
MRFVSLVFILLLGSGPAFAQGWATAVRTEARVVEDSNVFLQDEAPLAAGQTGRFLPVRAEDQEFVGAVAVSASRKPAPGRFGPAVDFGYTGEWHRFSDWQQESHRDHRLLAAGRWTTPAWTADGKLTLLQIDGSHSTPVYTDRGGLPGMGGEPVRSRRSQTVTNATAALLWQPESGAWRVRPSATLLYQDFHTIEGTQPVGCANYVDRGQGLLGVDVGRAVRADATAWFSVRAGRQWQADLLGRPENSASSILRPLVGFEGQVQPTLKLSAWAGPSFHNFTSDRRAGTPAHRMIPYFETSAAWTISAADALTLNARHQLWPGASGRSAYRELKADAGWTHRFASRLETGLRAGLLHGNFGGFAASPRNDNVFTTATSLAVPVGRRWRIESSVTREWSETRVPQTEGRAYHRWLTALGAAKTW